MRQEHPQNESDGEWTPVFWDTEKTWTVWIFGALVALLVLLLPVVLSLTARQTVESALTR
jgi:hypothetical protein